MTPPQPQTPIENAQSPEQLIFSFLELIRRIVQTIPPMLEAAICGMFALNFIENNDAHNRNEHIEKGIY